MRGGLRPSIVAARRSASRAAIVGEIINLEISILEDQSLVVAELVAQIVLQRLVGHD
jgi:hypothetical protein